MNLQQPLAMPPSPVLCRQRRITVFFGGRALDDEHVYGMRGGVLLRGDSVGNINQRVAERETRDEVLRLQEIYKRTGSVGDGHLLGAMR